MYVFFTRMKLVGILKSPTNQVKANELDQGSNGRKLQNMIILFAVFNK